MNYLEKSDIGKIENELGISLPQHYKDFHSNKRHIIKKLRESDSKPDDDSLWIATDVEHIIEYNRFSGIPKKEGPTRNKFYIGGDGCGSSCFIELEQDQNTKVYFICPDDFEEIFDEAIDDFKWDLEQVLVAKSLEEFALNKMKSQEN